MPEATGALRSSHCSTKYRSELVVAPKDGIRKHHRRNRKHNRFLPQKGSIEYALNQDTSPANQTTIIKRLRRNVARETSTARSARITKSRTKANRRNTAERRHTLETSNYPAAAQGHIHVGFATHKTKSPEKVQEILNQCAGAVLAYGAQHLIIRCPNHTSRPPSPTKPNPSPQSLLHSTISHVTGEMKCADGWRTFHAYEEDELRASRLVGTTFQNPEVFELKPLPDHRDLTEGWDTYQLRSTEEQDTEVTWVKVDTEVCSSSTLSTDEVSVKSESPYKEDLSPRSEAVTIQSDSAIRATSKHFHIVEVSMAEAQAAA